MIRSSPKRNVKCRSRCSGIMSPHQFQAVIDSCSTVAIATHTRYGTWATAIRRTGSVFDRVRAVAAMVPAADWTPAFTAVQAVVNRPGGRINLIWITAGCIFSSFLSA